MCHVCALLPSIFGFTLLLFDQLAIIMSLYQEVRILYIYNNDHKWVGGWVDVWVGEWLSWWLGEWLSWWLGG